MKYRKIKSEINPYQKRLKKRIIIGGVIIALLVTTILLVLNEMNKDEPFVSKYNVCGLAQEEIITRFEDYTFNEVLGVKDYFFYGETFSMYDKEYVVGDTNELVGKTLLLTNICTDEEFHYLIDVDVNGQIPLQNLPVGFYELFINVDMVKKRVVFNEKVIDKITLVTRDNRDRYVEIIGDTTIFDDNKHTNLLDKNYAFVNVEMMENDSEDYDIVLDPTLGINASGYFNDYGLSNLGLVEADELYSIAQMIKEELEAEGLKVLITRDDNEHIINSYGKDGRLQKSYDSKAKYYIELGFNNSSDGSLKIFKSSYVSNAFSAFVANSMLENSTLKAGDTQTVLSATRFKGLDGVINIRETGGKALGAATYSELSLNENGHFALDNRHALESISIEYFNFSNEDQLNLYKNKKEEYASATAQALIQYIKLGVSNDISD